MTRVFVPWGELLGNNPTSPLFDRANAARRIACNVRALNPAIFHSVSILTPATPFQGTPGINRFMWDRLCPESPIPQPVALQSQPPFIGGQCITSYSISYQVTERNGTFAGSGAVVLTGAIQTLHVAVEPQGTTQQSAVIYYRAPTHAGGNLVRNAISTRSNGVLAIPTFTITRVDGLPDSCGNNPGNSVIPPVPPSNNITIPISYDNQTRPVTVNLPTLNTGNWPNFSFTPVFDVEGTRFEFMPDGLVLDFNPAINLQPPGMGGGNQTTNIRNTVGDILGIVTNIQQNPPVPSSPSMAVALPFAECGSEPVIENISGELPTVLGLALSKIAANLDTIGTRVCDNVAVVPEWWQTRPGQRSQLVIQFAGLNADNTENRNRWSLVVPHYRYGEAQPISLPIYQKGRFFACLTLDDNSKIWVNAKTQALAISYVRRLSLLVKPAMLPNPLDIHSGERRGTALVEMKTRAVRASYFSTGQKNMSPDWVKSLR